MKDYITTAFTVVVGLLDADKLVYLALVGLGILLIWQLFSLMASFHSGLAKKCRKISKFLNTKGLSANNYNTFLGLVAKMPQEFIRGYKAFEHASYGLPSDYIRRFDSVDVEINGGISKQGRSLQKAFIYVWAMVIAIISLALLGEETALTGYAVADALLTPALFIILARVLYFIYTAIRQQQYRVAVDEFNEMLDIMNDKIENNDNLPGPDILADVYTELQQVENQPDTKPATQAEQLPAHDNKPQTNFVATDVAKDVQQPASENASEKLEVVEDSYSRDDLLKNVAAPEEEVVDETQSLEQQDQSLSSNDLQDVSEADVSSLLDEIEQEAYANDEEEQILIEQPLQSTQQNNIEHHIDEPNKAQIKDNQKNPMADLAEEESLEETNEKRGRGRPKKVPEGQLVITSDKQFEEVLDRAEKLMRKSQTALSSSQAKRVEKSLKELLDAMSKYKDQQ